MLKAVVGTLLPGNSPKKSAFYEPTQPSAEYLWYLKHSERLKSISYNLNQYDRMYESVPYKLSVSNFSNMKISRKDKNSELYIRVKAVFVSKSKRCHLSELQTFLVRVDLNSKGMLTILEPGIAYYHSKINRSVKDVALLLEFACVQKLRQTTNILQLGFSLIQPFNDVNQNTSPIRRGNWLKNQQETTGMEFKYSINFTIQLKNLVRIVPEDTIVNCNQSIICLVGSTLPNSIEKSQIVLSRSSLLKIKNFQIILSNKFESELKTVIEKIKQSFCREDRSNRINIKKRMIRLGFHNGLTLVSQITKELEFDKSGKKDSNRLKIIDKMRDDENIQLQIWKDVQGVFVCGMVYDVQLQGKDYKQSMNFQVTMFVKAFSNKQKFGQIEDTMMIGPGFGISGTILKVPGQEPLINFQYSIQERSYTNAQTNFSPYKTTKNNFHQQSRQYFSPFKQKNSYQEDYMRVEQQKMRLEQNLNLLKSMHQIKETQKARLASQLQHQRQEYFEAQQLMHNNVTELTKDQVSMEFQIKELQQKLRVFELQREQEKKNREEEAKAALVEKRKLAEMQRNNYNKPGNKIFVKNKKEQQISSMLYDALQKKFITPIIKNSDIVDASQYEQYKTASRFVINFLSVRWDQPRSIYIIVRFFNIAGFKTSTIKQSQLQAGEGKLIKQSLGSSQLQTEAMYEFIIDPSLSSNPESLQTDLVNYLFNKNLILDVYDSQTHFYLGQLNFGLKDTLRGKKDRVISLKESLLVSEGKPICNLHIMITNQMIECKRQGGSNKNRLMQKNNRILSTAPLVIPDSSKNRMLEGALIESITREDRRLQRIKLSKQRKLLDNSNKDNLNPQQKQGLLSQIQQYKKQNKSQFIKEVYQDFLNDHKQISCYFGKLEVFNYTFTNTEPRTAEFRVSIQDPDEGLFTNPELSLINKPLEWRHFCQSQNYQFPKSFQCISETNCFKLAPNESLDLLFKFVTFRRMSGYGQDSTLKQRMLNVLVMNTSNNSVNSGFSLKVEPHEQVIDRSLIMFENAQEPIELIIPLLSQLPKSSISKPHLISTFVQSTVSWLSQYQLSVKAQSLPVMNRLIFNVLLYDNQYMDSIKENWRVQLNSYEGISLVCKQSAPVKFRLAIPQDFCNKRVFLFSSSPEVSFLSDVSNGMFTAENSVTVISGQAVNPSNQKKSVLVHLVQAQSKALVYGWKLNILPWNFRNTFS